jgi:hypothetical protein
LVAKVKPEIIAKLKAEKQRQKEQQDVAAGRKKLEQELDQLDGKLEELKMLYDQYFIDVLLQPPDKKRAEAVKTIRALLKSPFRNSASRFRLRMLVHRYHVYATYWERVLREREEGRYNRDLFKAELREKLMKEAEKEASRGGRAERSMRQLFRAYEQAVLKTGGTTKGLNFDAFKQSLLKKARQLKEQSGAQALRYKIVVKEGKVVVKASAKS